MKVPSSSTAQNMRLCYFLKRGLSKIGGKLGLTVKNVACAIPCRLAEGALDGMTRIFCGEPEE